MSGDTSTTDARSALGAIENRRLQVIEQINVPSWYWIAVAACWLGLGVLSDNAPSWVTIAATFAFGCVHSAIAPRVLSGGEATSQLKVRSELTGRRIRITVLGFLVALVGVTIGLALVFQAVGASQPATLASAVVAALILIGGPFLVGAARRRIAANLRSGAGIPAA